MKGGFQPKSPKKGTHKRRKSNSSSKMTSSKSPVSYMGGKRRSSRKRRSGKKMGGEDGCKGSCRWPTVCVWSPVTKEHVCVDPRDTYSGVPL
jgi:hypothetical protein